MTNIHRDSGGWSSASIYDPPEEVWLLSYCWQSGAASSAERLFFFDLGAALRYLDQVERDGKTLAPDRPVVLQCLRPDPEAWEHVLLQKPEGWRVADVPPEPRCEACGEVREDHPPDTPFVAGPVDDEVGGLGPRAGGPR